MNQIEKHEGKTQDKPGVVKKSIKAVFAVAVSAGLVGTFAIPAYSSPSQETVQFSSKAPQKLTTVNAPAAELVVDALAATENLELKDRERAERVREEEERIKRERAESLSAEQAFSSRVDIPAGFGGSGLAAAALAQLGAGQDCTDLVQNALAAIGASTRRDQGGYDMGVGDFYGVGSNVTGSALAPGDILIWGGHVAVYIGNGQAVHGGWMGYGTAVSSATHYGAAPGAVMRVG